MLRQVGTLLALVAIALATTAGSASAAGWLPSVNAETSDDAGFATEVAVDAQGAAVGVWARHVSGLQWEIVASSRPRGGKWTVPVAVSGDTRTGEILRAKVAVDPNGDAVAVWAAKPPASAGNENVFKALWSASRTPGGAWSGPEKISTASGVSEFDVVIDASGTATAIWHSLLEEEDDPPGSFVRAASHPLGGTWSSPVELSGPANGGSPKIAVNPAGDLTAVWTGVDPDTDNTVVRSKSRPAGGAWSATATDLSSDAGDATEAQVSVDPGGGAIAAWSYSEEEIGGDDDIGIQTAYRDGTSGTWSPPTSLWDDAADEKTPEIALATDLQGNTTAIWSSFAPGGNVMRSATRTAGAAGTWSTPTELSTADGGSLLGKPTNPRIVADPQGSVTATWSAAVGPNPGIGVTENRRLQAVHRPAGGAWGSPVALSSPGDLWAAEIAVDPQGYVTALWSETFAVRSRVFDSVAPLLQSVTVPATGIIGEPVAMSVSPFDVWSSVATGWDFGDGDSGSGTTVGHCYETPGEYTVTIAGTDLAANTASATRTIEIEADPDAGADPCAPDPDPGPGPNPGPGPDTGPDPGPGVSDPGGGGNLPPAQTCLVPKLAGRTLAEARVALKEAGCKLGTVRRPRLRKGQRRPPLVVKSTTPRAGVIPVDERVDLRLGKKRPRLARR